MTINTEVKGTLARLLATENLIVEHSNVSTAQFNVHTRVLTLPMWKTASQDVYDLLVGHEVGHALYTPDIDWRKDPQNNGLPMSFVNVTEDARIEKLMKRKFPGLSRNFNRGYTELDEQDFFGIAEDDVDELELIDRINLHFKLGIHSLNTIISFNAEEQSLVDMVEESETFDEALAAARAVFEYQKAEKEFTETVEVSMKPDVTQEGAGDSQIKPVDSEPSNMEMEGKSQKPQSADADQPNEESDVSGDSGGLEAKTDTSLKEKLKDMTEAFNKYDAPVYVEIPDYDLKEYIYPLEQFHKILTSEYKSILKRRTDTQDTYTNYRNKALIDEYTKAINEYRSFKQDSQKEVNYMVKEFEMKKSADAYSRSSVSRTGVLDTNKLHTYKWNEDVFKKITVTPGAKNHGMIFILDWSGSMSETLIACVRQIITMCWFCRKVGIPFEVYAFSESVPSSEYTTRTNNLVNNSIRLDDSTCLINMLSSKTNNAMFEQHVQNLYVLSSSCSSQYYNSYLSAPGHFGLSGTPLNQVICLYKDLIPHFQKTHKVQKLTLLTLTDGEDGGIFYQRYYEKHDSWGHGGFTNRTRLRNRRNGRVYSPGYSHNQVTQNFIRYAKDMYPEVKFLGIRMCGSEAKSFIRSISDNEETINKSIISWEKEKCAVITTNGYEQQYVLPAGSYLSQNAEFEVEQGASTAEIRKAFTKMLQRKAINKTFLRLFIGSIA
jgi:hypothetical protein